MTVRILHTADLQIGRTPSRLPEQVQASPVKVWDRIVDYAIREKVDALTLGGDIVDAENRYYEAYGPLEHGIRRLSKAGVPVVAVAGNHDVEVFPALADAMEQESFILLGRGGRWERHTLTKDDAPALHIDGWSFPHEKHHDDPVADHRLETPHDAPVVGLVHGDLDQPQSVYAPLSRSRLRQKPMAAWLLGHVHKPQAIQEPDGPLILYPGSPQGLDPGETGRHGAWTLCFDSTGLQETRLVPMASAIYAHHEIDLDGAETEQEVRRRVVRGTNEHLANIAREEHGPLEHVVYRLHLTGRTPLHGRLRHIIQGIQDDTQHQGLRFDIDGITAHVDKSHVETTPRLDLEETAQGTGPPADLARVLISVRDGDDTDPLSRAILKDASTAVEDLLDSVHYQTLRKESGTTQQKEARRLVQEQGLLLLEALIAQPRGPEGGES